MNVWFCSTGYEAGAISVLWSAEEGEARFVALCGRCCG